MTPQTVYMAIGCFIVGLSAGMKLTVDHYETKLADQALSAAVSAAEQGKRDYEKLVKASNALAEAKRADAVRADELDRLRKSVKRAERTSSDACRMEREAIASCERILKRSAENLNGCVRLLRENASVHDAFVTAVTGE